MVRAQLTLDVMSTSTREDDEQTSGDNYLGYPESPAHPPAPRVYTPHPLFPRDDGTLEDADIQFVSFLRRTPDGGMKHCPLDFPAEEMQSWEQVVDLWGGGEYQAIAKDKYHRVLRHCPTANRWNYFDGEPRPLVKPPRPGTSSALAPRPVEQAAPTAMTTPAGMAELVASVVALVKEVREMKAAPASQGGTNDIVLAERHKSRRKRMRGRHRRGPMRTRGRSRRRRRPRTTSSSWV